jgi:SAM-dependent methyltransferase
VALGKGRILTHNGTVMPSKINEKNLQAEFDLLADDYYQDHKTNIAITGEGPEYFSRYKIADFAEYFKDSKAPSSILDFGSGIGNSIPYFREYFPQSELFCCDVSTRSMEISRKRFPGKEKYLKIDERIPALDHSFDSAFTACVFHHIPHDDHNKWIGELRRVMQPGGVLVIYEHNPLNPLTIRAVNNCPFDVNARLIRAGKMKRLLVDLGWRDTIVEYKIFFPAALKSLRFAEKYMRSIFFGAQWRLTAIK